MCLSQSSSLRQPCAVLGWAQEANSPFSSCWPSKSGPDRRGLPAAGPCACLPLLWPRLRPVLLLWGPAVPGAGGQDVAEVFLPEQSLLLTGRGLAPWPSGEWAGCEVWLQNSGSGVCKTTRPSCSPCRGPRRGQGMAQFKPAREPPGTKGGLGTRVNKLWSEKNHSAW